MKIFDPLDVLDIDNTHDPAHTSHSTGDSAVPDTPDRTDHRSIKYLMSGYYSRHDSLGQIYQRTVGAHVRRLMRRSSAFRRAHGLTLADEDQPYQQENAEDTEKAMKRRVAMTDDDVRKEVQRQILLNAMITESIKNNFHLQFGMMSYSSVTIYEHLVKLHNASHPDQPRADASDLGRGQHYWEKMGQERNGLDFFISKALDSSTPYPPFAEIIRGGFVKLGAVLVVEPASEE